MKKLLIRLIVFPLFVITIIFSSVFFVLLGIIFGGKKAYKMAIKNHFIDWLFDLMD